MCIIVYTSVTVCSVMCTSVYSHLHVNTCASLASIISYIFCGICSCEHIIINKYSKYVETNMVAARLSLDYLVSYKAVE